MHWFSRKVRPSDDRQGQAADEPFYANDQTVSRVAELLTMWNDALGVDEARGDAAVLGIRGAAGLGDIKSQIEWVAKTGMAPGILWDRPWKMLADVARYAAQHGDHLLPAKVLVFAFTWDTQIAPQLNATNEVNFADKFLFSCPNAVEAEIATIAFDSIRQLPSNQIIFSNMTGSLTAADCTKVAAIVIVHAPEKGVPMDEAALAKARSVLGRE